MEFAEGLPSIESDSLYELAEGVAETGQTLFAAGNVIETLDSCGHHGCFHHRRV